MSFLIRTHGGKLIDIETRWADLQQSADGDDRYINACLSSCWLSLLSDSPVNGPKPSREYTRFQKDLEPGVILATIDRYSKLSHDLVSQPYRGEFGSQKGPFLNAFKDTPVFREYLAWYKEGDAELLRYLLSFLNYGKKAEYPYEQLNQVAFHAWQSVEDRLQTQVVPNRAEDLFQILSKVLPRFSPQYPRPRFGSGSVAEKGVRGRIRKSSSFRYDARVDRAIFTGSLSLATQLGWKGLRPYDCTEHGPRGPVQSQSLRQEAKFSKVRPEHPDFVGVERTHATNLQQVGDSQRYDSVEHAEYPRGFHRPDVFTTFWVSIDASHLGDGKRCLAFPCEEIWSPRVEIRSTGVARMHAVAKSYKTSRLICMEPNSFMWAQQAVLAPFLGSIQRSCYSRAIDIHDQSRNQEGARYGSLTGKLDTIDLSSASDSVQWALVKRIFPRWLTYLFAGTRTTKVKVLSGEVVAVNKFAPMGSALCFPTQCVIFTTICLYAAMLHYRGLDASGRVMAGDRLLMDPEWAYKRLFSKTMGDGTGAYEPLYVYGDDIVVDARLTPIVMSLLAEFGFEVNVTKSFIGQQLYRESCGKHFMEGEDVTPLYWKVKNLSEELNPSSFPALCAMANRAYGYGYKTVRSYLIHFLHESGRTYGHNAILFTNNPVEGSTDSRTACAILTNVVRHRSKNGRGRPAVKQRYNPDYQRWEVSSLGVTEGKRVKPTKKESWLLELYLYDQWVQSAPYRIDLSDAASLRHDMLRPALRRRWTPAA